MDPISIAMGLAQFAPGIVKMLTGSDKAEEVAQQVVGIAQTVTGTATPQDAIAAIHADPGKILEFRQAMASLALEQDRIELADIQNARDNNVKLAQAGHQNYRANLLAGGAALLVLLCLFIMVWKSDLSADAKTIISLILGRALGWVEQVFSFDFGTTRTNKTKDDTINKLTK